MATAGTPASPPVTTVPIEGSGRRLKADHRVHLSTSSRRTSMVRSGSARCKDRRPMPSGLVSRSDPIDAQQILIEQEGNFQFLLETETVWDIALDGGNRKWLATVNNRGVPPLPDGREQVAHFTAENSPLPSNEVYDFALDQASGCLFRHAQWGHEFPGSAHALQGTRPRRSLTIFPNPWRPSSYDAGCDDRWSGVRVSGSQADPR